MPKDENTPLDTEQPKKKPHVVLSWKDHTLALTVDGQDLTGVTMAGSVRIEVPRMSGPGKPVIHFAVLVDDFHVEGVGVVEERVGRFEVERFKCDECDEAAR